MYIAMLVFDAAVLAGFIYLIVEKNWSPWWFALALFIMMGSLPKTFLKFYQEMERRE